MIDQKHRLNSSMKKVFHAHFNLFKLLFYCLLSAFCFMAFGITFAFFSHKISFNNIILQAPQHLYALTTTTSTPPPRLRDHKVVDIVIPPPRISNPSSAPADSIMVQTNDDNKTGEMIMSDEELIWRAAKKGKRMKNEQVVVPKIAFLFLVKGSLPLAPLWEEFFKGHQDFYSIFVHSDPSFNSSSELDTGVFRGKRIHSKEVEWGNFSMIEAELRLLGNALLDTSNQRFVLLSESCIPLFNFSTIYSYLMNSTETYIEAYDKVGPTGRGRFKYPLWPTVKLDQWRKGSQWFEIDRDLAIEVISDQGFFLVFKRACTAACYADEHYLPTWANVKSGPKNSNRSLTWVDWSKGGSHPARYRRMHVTIEFLEGLRSNETCTYNGETTNVCYLFARKFMADSLDRLLRFSPKVMKF